MGLIGAAIGAAGSIAGGIVSSNAMKKAKKAIEQQVRKNQDWYDRRYNEDATQRADAQRLLTMTEESIKNRNRNAAGSQAVMGGTDESTAAAKAANNQALSETMSNINAQADARKDAIERQYQARDAELQNQLQNIELGKAQAVAGAVQGVTNAASQMDFGEMNLGKTKLPL